jgi:hypothetical protein
MVSILVGCGGAAPAVVATKEPPPAAAASADAPPERRPADFEVSFSIEDGAASKATNLACTEAGCVMTQLANGEIDDAKAPVSAAQLDAVYQAVLSSRFAEVAKGHAKPGTPTVSLWVKAGAYYGESVDADKVDQALGAVRAAATTLASDLHLELDKPLPGVAPKAKQP